MLVALVVLVNTVVYNPSKPLIGNHAIWKLDRSQKVTSQSSFAHDMLYLADQDVPQGAVLGLATQSSIYEEYGLYGENFTPKVIPVYPPELVDDGTWLSGQGIQYLLI